MKLLTFLFSTFAFTLLFYKQNLGVNVLLFNLLIFSGLIYLKRLLLPTLLSKIIFTSVLMSGVFVVFHHTDIAINIHVLNWVLFIGLLNFNSAKKISSLFFVGIINTFSGVKSAVKSIFNSKNMIKKRKKINISLYIIPLVIILGFLFIYRASNPIFNDFILSIIDVIFRPFKHISIAYIATFTLGILICSPIIFELNHNDIEQADSKSSDFLKRVRFKHKSVFKINGLTNEYQAGIFLLFTLNILLFVVNCFDIYSVWFNFEFNGQTLKTFVHQGTYMLIFSILISMGIVLYFFRNNLNFYKLNSKLKTLTYLWILQNIVLTGSVFARCYHYINHFGMAYKRIGVIVFLIAVIIGLISIYTKVKTIKSSSYLWRVNLLSVFILLNSLTFFNWDVIIAKFNISNYKKSFVHFTYLSHLSNNALFALQLTPQQLEQISTVQKDKYTFSSFKNSHLNLSSEEYYEQIEFRKFKFKNQWENSHWLSWNYAESNCYKHLISTP